MNFIQNLVILIILHIVTIVCAKKYAGQDILLHQVNYSKKERRLLARRLSSKCGIFALGMEGLEYRNIGCNKISTTEADPFVSADPFVQTMWRCSSFDEKSEDSFCCKEHVDDEGGETSRCKQLCCTRAETERVHYPDRHEEVIQYKLQWMACEDVMHNEAYYQEYQEAPYDLCLGKSRYTETIKEGNKESTL